jgi:hypothetical protein
MKFLLLIFAVAGSLNEKSMEVRFTPSSPAIDGYIEDIWSVADSACDFVQNMPYENKEPSEKTVVFILQDKANLYVAFRCYTDSIKPVGNFATYEDHVSLYIDTFNDKTKAYAFKVNISNTFIDGKYLDDGRSTDPSWEGVWYHAVKTYDDRYEIEMKIPFKSIRYKKGISEWGINLKRYITKVNEFDYWMPVSQKEGFRISKFGKLTGINPKSAGYYFELYPEGFARYDQFREEDDEKKLSGSLNLKWDVTSQTTINATTYPDFAHIESDPFTLNLSRYPTYLAERRPFFIEGSDIFRMSNFESSGFFSPLEIFYSRKIGKALYYDIIPIIAGLKATHKTKKWNFGVLGAYTDPLDTERERSFGVVRTQHQVFENSDIGMLVSGTMADRDNDNYAIGIDGTYRKGPNQLIIQSAFSDKNKKQGYAISSGFRGFMRSLYISASARAIQDSFDVSEMGYVPWIDTEVYALSIEPFKYYKTGFLRSLYYGPGIIIYRDPFTDRYGKTITFSISPNFRNDLGLSVYGAVGRSYEANLDFLFRQANFYVWARVFNQQWYAGLSYNYSYNYRRAMLAHQGSNYLGGGYNITSQVKLSFDANTWVEWDTLDAVIAVTSVVTPRMEYRINAAMTLSLFNEFVTETPKTELSNTELLSNRIGMLYSWNFRPKSWLYIALNDYQVADEQGTLHLQNRISAIKVKYLLYF